MMSGGYVGRFAPSPTGPLHAGSLVAALASWLDARTQGGRWLVRIEDVDLPRCVPGAEEIIFAQLADCGLLPDEYEPLRQSARGLAYQTALDRLQRLGLTYECGCTRRAIEDAMVSLGLLHERFEERVYPGTCRGGLHGKPARATRDGIWAYQLAVVVDDAHQGVTDVVRGEDLADNTARQIHLQRLLCLPELRYLHTPLVLGPDGHKLSKQNGAQSLDTQTPLARLREAGAVLQLPVIEATSVPDWLAAAVKGWRSRWVARAVA
jgi:glutamyl-Q tRNA(Asp) synthetase